MLVDAWASYFAKAKQAGNGELIEDDSFDLNQILDDLERQGGDASALSEDLPEDVPDDWEEPETWGVETHHHL